MYNVKTTKELKGFTLMEVLVSSSIFALILIFTTAAVSQSSGYQSKLSILNKTSEETRRFADMISNDVREANTNLKVRGNVCDIVGSPVTNHDFKNGIAILRLSDDGLSYCVDYQKQIEDNSKGNVLVVSNKEGYKIYAYKAKVVEAGLTKGIYYSRYSKADSTIITQNQINETLVDSNLVSKNNLLVSVTFGGFAPEDTALNYGQSIVRFDIKASAPDTSIAKGESEIRSAVTSRSYN